MQSEDPISATRCDSFHPTLVLAAGSLGLSLAWNYFFWGHGYGVGIPVLMVLAITTLALSGLLSLKANPITVLALLALLIGLSTCAAWYRNRLVLTMTVPTIYVALAALPFAGRTGFSFANALGVVESVVQSAFQFWRSAITTGQSVSEALFDRDNESKQTSHRILWGLLISMPFLLVFGWLFRSADPLFDEKMSEVFELLFQTDFWVRALVVVVVAWVLTGYLGKTASVASVTSRFDTVPPKQRFEGLSTVVFMLMNNLLFLAFIVIQVEYLFGGDRVIRSTNLTYAEYARKGFYELCIVVVIVSALIAMTNHCMKPSTVRVRRWLELSWMALIAQTLVIIASSIKRISVYEEAYGYTYLRILVALFLLWTATYFVLFLVKIAFHRSLVWLASCTLCSALLLLVLVSACSVDRFIARRNIDRHLKQQEPIDMEYLGRLSSDAVPEIARLATAASDEDIRDAANELLSRHRASAEREISHWPSWNRSLARAAAQP